MDTKDRILADLADSLPPTDAHAAQWFASLRGRAREILAGVAGDPDSVHDGGACPTCQGTGRVSCLN